MAMEPIMSMIERVARALCIANGLDPDADWRVSDGIMLSIAIPEREAQNWWLYISKARAAIEAMREPTDEMMKAFDNETHEAPCTKWQVMIDKALERV